MLDLERPGCPLYPGFQLTVQSSANEVRPETDEKPATWDARLSGTQLYYAYKRFRAGADNCDSLAGCSAPVLVAAAPVISDPIGREDGYYFLCVIARDTSWFDSSWQQPSLPSMRFKRLDSQPPLVPVDYEIGAPEIAYRLVFGTGGGERPTWDSPWRREGRCRRRAATSRETIAFGFRFRTSSGPPITRPGFA